jgi:hypothetical protein
MARLYAGIRIDQERSLTRQASTHLDVFAKTWDVQVDVEMWPDGRYTVVATDIKMGSAIQRMHGQWPLPDGHIAEPYQLLVGAKDWGYYRTEKEAMQLAELVETTFQTGIVIINHNDNGAVVWSNINVEV